MARAGGGERAPVPAGWRLRADPLTRTWRKGTVLAGGGPLRVLTLSEAGGALVAGWLRGEPVGEGTAARGLARRLLDAGLAHPVPVGEPDAAGHVTVVIPVRDRAEQLERCLQSLGGRCPVIVVDDGSARPAETAEVAERFGAEMVALSPGRGVSAARNAGLRAARTSLVAFLDSDCVAGEGFPGALAAHLADPAVAVAAPRIGAMHEDDGLLARYEAGRSALDMGPRAGLVAPGTAIPYVPSAALAVRRSALGEGFDESLHFGEDVDLLWRLHDAGWQIRYDPSVVVRHDHRTTPRAWAARRMAYNSSTAVLHARHPGKVPALSLSRTGAGVWAAVGAGSPVLAGAITGVTVLRLRRTLAGRVPGAGLMALRLVVAGQLHEGRHLARALTGPWLPFTMVLVARSPALRRRVGAGLLVAGLWEWSRPPRLPTPLHYLAPRVVEDVARCAGVWAGCLRTRSFGALAPVLRRG